VPPEDEGPAGAAQPAVATQVAPPPAAPDPESEHNPLLAQLAHLRAAERASREQLARHPAQPETQATHEQHIDAMPGLTAHKRNFLKAHPELLEPANAQAANFHYQQALARGVKDDTSEMNEYILHHMGGEMQRRQVAHALDAATAAPPLAPPPSIPVSAPVSREVPGGGYQPRGEIRLSPQEREMARISGVSETEYARNKIRLLQAKAAGRYMEPS